MVGLDKTIFPFQFIKAESEISLSVYLIASLILLEPIPNDQSKKTILLAEHHGNALLFTCLLVS